MSSMPPEALYFPIGTACDLYTWIGSHQIKSERATINAWLDHGLIVDTLSGRTQYLPYSTIHHLTA